MGPFLPGDPRFLPAPPPFAAGAPQAVPAPPQNDLFLLWPAPALPALPGSPWRRPAFPQTAGYGVPVLPGTPQSPLKVTLAGVPLLARVPNETEPRRLARFTEKVADILNSLAGTGQLVQTGPKAFKIVAGTGGGTVNTTGLTGKYGTLA